MKQQGSYTVEAAWILSITIFIVFLTIATGFWLYETGLEFLMNECRVQQIDTVTVFREISFGKDVLGLFTD